MLTFINGSTCEANRHDGGVHEAQFYTSPIRYSSNIDVISLYLCSPFRGGCSMVIAKGESETGKSAAIRAALSLFGCENILAAL